MTLQDCSLVARSGQGLRLAVHSRYPAADDLDPLAVIDAARVRHIGKGAGGQAAHGGTIEIGGLHLGKARGGLAEHEHNLGHALIRGKAQSRGAGCQGIILAGGEVIGQSAVLPAVHTIGDLIGAGEVIRAGDNSVQPHLGGDGIPPIKTVQPDIGGIGDAGEGVAHRLAVHDLLGAGFGNGHAGSQALVGHLKFDDLSLMFQIGGEFRFIYAVIGRSLDLPDGIAGERQRFGHGQPSAVGADGVH